MGEYSKQPQLNGETEKPLDWLPDGIDTEHSLGENKEWVNIEKRLGQPRILENVYFSEVFDWIQRKYKDNPDDFSFFEAGCGHGNDLRAIKKELGGKGRFLGVDMSRAEITHGLEFYQQQENTDESRKLFAQGDLRDLGHINTWNDEEGNFSRPTEVKDDEFDLVYMEAVLHGLGYGKKTYHEKRKSAQQMLNELYRICKAGGRFFGRANTFGPAITEGQQLKILRKTNNWHFFPRAEEFEDMLKRAGFIVIKTKLVPYKKPENDPTKINLSRFSFLAEK